MEKFVLVVASCSGGSFLKEFVRGDVDRAGDDLKHKGEPLPGPPRVQGFPSQLL